MTIQRQPYNLKAARAEDDENRDIIINWIFSYCETIAYCELIRNASSALASMPPSKKQKAAPSGAAPGKRGAPSSAGGQQGDTEMEQRGLDPKAVKEFLNLVQRSDRLGSDFFDDKEKMEWQQWLDAVPASASEAADSRMLLPVQMPPKCRPRAAAGSGLPCQSTLGQQELITYTNAGGRQFGRSDRQRQHAHAKPLAAADVKVGSTVALRRDASAADSAPGYGTPFYIGDVLQVSASPAGQVDSLTIHFRMPQGADSLFCNDLCKPWGPEL